MGITSASHQSSSYKSLLLFESSKYDSNDIIIFDELGNRHSIKDSIQSVREIDNKEMVILKSGSNIPLDKIYSVDGETSPLYDEGFFSCDCV